MKHQIPRCSSPLISHLGHHKTIPIPATSFLSYPLNTTSRGNVKLHNAAPISLLSSSMTAANKCYNGHFQYRHFHSHMNPQLQQQKKKKFSAKTYETQEEKDEASIPLDSETQQLLKEIFPGIRAPTSSGSASTSPGQEAKSDFSWKDFIPLPIQKRLFKSDNNNVNSQKLKHKPSKMMQLINGERLKMRFSYWPWLIMLCTTCVATGVILSLWQATYTERAHLWFQSDLLANIDRFKLVELLSFNSYNWSFLHKENIIGDLINTLEQGCTDPEEWFYSIHSLFALMGSIRVKRKLFVDQFVEQANVLNLLYCLKDPLLLRASNQHAGAEVCVEELVSIIYAAYLKDRSSENRHPAVDMNPEMERLMVEFAEHGSLAHKRLASEFIAQYAVDHPLLQEYVDTLDLKDMWRNMPDLSYQENIVRNLAIARRSFRDVDEEEETPKEFRPKKSSTIKNALFEYAQFSRSQWFISTLRALSYGGAAATLFWMARFKGTLGLSFGKSALLASKACVRPALYAGAINFMRLSFQYAEEWYLGKEEKSKSTIVSLAVAHYLIQYLVALSMVWFVPEFALAYPLVVYMIPWNAFSTQLTACGVATVPRKDYSYHDPMFFKAERRVY